MQTPVHQSKHTFSQHSQMVLIELWCRFIKRAIVTYLFRFSFTTLHSRRNVRLSQAKLRKFFSNFADLYQTKTAPCHLYFFYFFLRFVFILCIWYSSTSRMPMRIIQLNETINCAVDFFYSNAPKVFFRFFVFFVFVSFNFVFIFIA